MSEWEPGWPWILDLDAVYSLLDEGLELYTAAVNLPGGAGACPFGVGWHPYLYAFDGLVDDAVLTFQAATTYVLDERGLPVSTAPVAGSEVDFSGGRRIGSAQLDQTYTDLARDSQGRASVELGAADGPGSAPPEPGCRADDGSPDMFRNGFGTIVLKEGETFEARWGLVPSHGG